MNLYRVVDNYFDNLDSNNKFESINVLLNSIGLNKEQIRSVDGLIEDITNNAIQRGFYNGVRSERKKGEMK